LLIFSEISIHAAIVAQDDAVLVRETRIPPFALICSSTRALPPLCNGEATRNYAGHAKGHYPSIHSISEPVKISQHSKPAGAPITSPRVLQKESIRVEADQCKRVSAVLRRSSIKMNDRYI